MMAFSRILALAAFVSVSLAAPQGAPRFPAGVNPSACPNYPYCDPLVDHGALTHQQQAAPAGRSFQHQQQFQHHQPQHQFAPAAPQHLPQQQPAFNPAHQFAFAQQPQPHQPHHQAFVQQQQPQFAAPAARAFHQPQQHFAAPQQQFAPSAAAFNPAAFSARPDNFARAAAAPAPAAAAPQPLPEQFPAGVNPAECPNFPYCHDGNNGNFAVAQGVHQQRLSLPPQPQQRALQHHAQQQRPIFVDQHQQHAAPQQFHHQQPQHFSAPAAAPASQGGARFPSGVNPQACPNYPYCPV